MRVVLVLALLGVVSGCAPRNIPVDPGPPAAPRVSWTLRTDPEHGSGGIVCRSDAPTPCQIALESGERGVYASLSLYLYPTSGKTTYKGSFFAGFLGDTGTEAPLNYEIAGDQRPTLFSRYGSVVDAPGSYEFQVAFDATVEGEEVPRRVDFKVPVRLTRGR